MDYTSSESGVEGLPNFIIGQNDPSITKKIGVLDDLSVAAGDSTFCGARKFTVTVAANETNPLAASYLACQSGVSCFQVLSLNSGAYAVFLTVSFS